MNCDMEDQPQSNILKCLAVTVTSKETRMTLESSTPGLMKESFQDTHPPKRHIQCYNKRFHKTIESVDVKVDDIKPRKEKKLDSIENTCDDEIKDLQKGEIILNEEENKKNG